MTEQLADLAARPTAEQILGIIPHIGVKEMLASAERRQRRMNSELDDIDGDEGLSLEGKQRRAQEVIDHHAEDIAQTYRDAQAKVEASAETSYKFSLPSRTRRPLPKLASRTRPRSWRCRAPQTTSRRG
jgi:hypothetical protein